MIQRSRVGDHYFGRDSRDRVVQGRCDVSFVVIVVVNLRVLAGSAGVERRSKADVIVTVFVIILHANVDSTSRC